MSQSVAPLRQEGQGESLKVTNSWSASVPSSSALMRLAGSPSISVAPQTVPTEGGLTVSAIGSVTVAADEGYVVIVAEQRFGSSGPEQMTDEERQQIRQVLMGIGVPGEAIEFEGLARYGTASISVEVELSELAENKDLILDTVEDVIRRSEAHGVRYTLSEENCEQALSLARREAIPKAERAADDLAQALGVERGAVIGALEYPLTNLPFGFAPSNLNSCGSLASDPYSNNLVPFDVEAEVTVALGLQITYAIR